MPIDAMPDDSALPLPLRLLVRERGIGQGLKIALVADELTSSCLAHECRFIDMNPLHNKAVLKAFKPDLLLVESAWKGFCNWWKFKIADYPQRRLANNRALKRLVANARDLGIPTVFWNKEDGVHFDRFIKSARFFDHIFTVDETCHDSYRAHLGDDISVHTMMFAVEPEMHSFTGFDFKHKRACFVGSYSHHIHDQRRVWQNMAFTAACETGLGLTVVDRNSDRTNPTYRYPDFAGIKVRPAVSHAETAQLYRDYLVSLNVNTVTDSPTMFSRRLVEILACGGIAVTSPSRAVDALFAEYCHVIHDAVQARELFARLHADGPSPDDLARARAGAAHVLAHHSWASRLDEMTRTIGIR